MRSRTLGIEAATSRARQTGLQIDALMTHNDQYRPEDFDLVITSLANAFYSTNEDGVFFWDPPLTAETFLNTLNIHNHGEAFQKMYVARSKDIAACSNTNIRCTRSKCKNSDCRFIPNYPSIEFNLNTGAPNAPWVPIEKIENLLD